MLAVTLEDRVLAHIDHHVEVATGATQGPGFAFAGQTDAVARVDARRHLDRQGLLLFHATLAMTGRAGLGNDLAAAVAARAGLLHREETLLHPHLANATTGGAGGRRGTWLGAIAVAHLALDQGGHANGDRGPAHCLFEVQIQGIAQIGTALRTAAATGTTAPAEEVAEDVAEDVGEVRAPCGAAETAAAHARIDASMAVLVVGRALARIGQHFVGLRGLLELLFGSCVPRIAIRVVFHRQASVGFLELGFAGAALDPEHLIVITFGHRLSAP